MKRCLTLLFLSLAFSFALSVRGFAQGEILRNEFTSEGKARAYYLYVPKTLDKSKPVPLMMMLHGSGRNGRILIEHWQKLADQEGIILAGPDALNPAGWGTPRDGPQFLYDLTEELKSKYPVDSHRVYLFGHSSGAIFALLMSCMESNYFAATAISAGALKPQLYSTLEDAERKIPISMFVGTKDTLFPLAAVRATRDVFAQNGFPVELTELPDHTHDYYSRSKEINEKAWAFLKKYKLESEQKYEQYQIG